MRDTGYAAAARWLRENGNEWVIRSGRATLRAGRFLGAATEEDVEVALVPFSATPPLHYDGVVLHGEGHSYLDAVQRAVGGLESDDDSALASQRHPYTCAYCTRLYGPRMYEWTTRRAYEDHMRRAHPGMPYEPGP